MNEIRILLIVFFVIVCSCKKQSEESITSIDIRSGYNFYHIVINQTGSSYSIKGKGSYESEPFRAEKVEDSLSFEVNSLDSFLGNLKKYEQNPLVQSKRADAARIEIYRGETKVYDTYSWDTDFWDIVKPIMKDIPDKVNPFIERNNF